MPRNSSIFHLGVASGDPTSSGVVLWTAVSQWVAGEQMTARVATDEAMTSVIYTTAIPGGYFGADRDYTVKVDTHGALPADSVLYYQFGYIGENSPIGRCRTLPLPAQSPPSLTLAVLTCRHYQEGWDHLLAGVGDVDYVVHLGDRIYENITPMPNPVRPLSLPSGEQYAMDLADYRYLYRAYYSDPHWQEMARRNTQICLWDDHEGANNFWLNADGTYGATDHPLADDPEAMTQLIADSRQALREYAPIRQTNDGFYRSFRFGTLAYLFALDERSYRDPPPCGQTFRDMTYTAGCAEMSNPERTMLGAAQYDWLTQAITTSPTAWQVLLNQVLMARLVVPAPDGAPPNRYIALDSWDGFPDERRRLAQVMAGKKCLALSGDLHTAMANVLYVDYDQPTEVAGIELMTTSQTARTRGEALYINIGLPPETHAQTIRNPLYNPHVKYVNGYVNGYLKVGLGYQYAWADWYVTDRYDENAPVLLNRSFRIDRETMTLVSLL